MSKFDPFRMHQNKQYLSEYKRLSTRFYRELTIPLFEFQCVKHGAFESYSGFKEVPETRPCPTCGKPSKRVEYSVPAKRNPEHGVQS